MVSLHFLTLLNHILKKKWKQTATNNNPHHTWIHCSQNTDGSVMRRSSLLHTQLSITILRQKQSPKGTEDWPKAHSVVSTRYMVKIKIPRPMGCTPPSSPHPIFCCPEEKPEIKIHIQKETEPSGELHMWKAGCAHSLATACSFLSKWKVPRALLFARIEKMNGFASEILQFLPAKIKSNRPGLFLWHCWD